MYTKLISSDSQLRPRVAKNVWQYSDQKTWLAFLQDITKTDCPEDLFNELDSLENYSDHDFFKQVKQLFCQKYQYISTFHATKVSNIDSFYTQGLIPLNTEQYNQQFIDIFQNYKGLNPPTLQQLNAAIERCKKSLTTRENRIYLQIREEELLTTSTHYLIYGSEYIHMLTNEIKPFSYSYKNHLKSCGIATILNMHVPIHQITNFNSFLLEVIKMVLNHQITEDYPLDLNIHTAVRIKPQDIHGHYHPDTHHLVDYIQL